MKIAISGIGGVGGFLGGMLLQANKDNDEHDIYFIARGDHGKAIAENGLLLHSHWGDFRVYPRMVTDDPALIGPVDLLLCCTKGYDLEENISQCSPCISSETSILPLLNGVDSTERIEKACPEHDVWQGCIYVVSGIEAPGVVRQSGNLCKVFFGKEDGISGKMSVFENLLTASGIEASARKDILPVIWEKFIFISPVASATSFFDENIGKILQQPEHAQALYGLLHELYHLAKVMNIPMKEEILEITTGKIQAMNYEATSSMHRDYQKGGRTEADSLTGYVVKKAAEYGVDVPFYTLVYDALTKRGR